MAKKFVEVDDDSEEEKKRRMQRTRNIREQQRLERTAESDLTLSDMLEFVNSKRTLR